jgi:4-diphosphocytidyl-2-C-methyl-D-erythritol kinase
MSKSQVAAYAKINLALYVLNKRDDGFHNIATIMQAIDLHDLIHLEVTGSGLALTCSDPGLSTVEDNLVLKAVRALEAQTGQALSLRIPLEKRIPVGAGLGGGSSDAAATLWAVNELVGLGLSPEQLGELAAGLGSDVPFFLSSGQALAEGRGEQLTALAWPVDYHAVIVFPGVFISAAEGYSRAKISLTNPLAQHKIRRSSGSETFWNWLPTQSNDLSEGVMKHHPEVAACLQAVRDLGAQYAGMTGSGSAVFGLFRDSVSAHVMDSLARTPFWRAFRARPLRSKKGVLPTLVKGI